MIMKQANEKILFDKPPSSLVKWGIFNFFFLNNKRSFDEKINILLIGCGTGRNAHYLSKLGHNVTGFDVSKESIALAKLRYVKYPVKSNFNFLTHNLKEGLPFDNDSFDLVIDIFVYNEQICNNTRKFYLKEVSRVLNTNGCILLGVHSFYDEYFLSFNAFIEFMKISEKLKFEKRHSWLSNGDQESVAEHCWQMSLLAILINDNLDNPVNISKVLKMIIIHDIVEAEVGDIPYFEISKRKELKEESERKAIANIHNFFNDIPIGREIYDLWYEFEDGKSPEAKFAKAIDNLEVQIQHNMAQISTWEPIEFELARTKMDPHCNYDSFLMTLCQLVKKDAEKKMSRIDN